MLVAHLLLVHDVPDLRLGVAECNRTGIIDDVGTRGRQGIEGIQNRISEA